MNILEHIEHAFIQSAQTAFSLPDSLINSLACTLNTDSSKSDFGDMSSNAALIIAKHLKKNPRDVAATLMNSFHNPAVERAEIAGPGFINFFLTQQAYAQLALEIMSNGKEFFVTKPAKAYTYSLEFVSANPTGPLHFGHGRGGIIGDVLGNVLAFLGHTVIKEFYINDAGVQIQRLGASLKARCAQQAGMDVQVPEDGYQGEYLISLAQTLFTEYGKALLEKPASFFENYAKNALLKDIKNTLAHYGIMYDVWFSEKTLHDSAAIEESLKKLQAHGYLYEQDGATWFKSTQFGDDKDRVVRKSSSELTYVAADIAYMENKIKRGAQKLIMVLGHDHHSYVTRLQGILKALDLGSPTLDVILYQLVKMTADGDLVRMSKRAGNIVTLQDIIDTVGKDVARFFYLNRKADAQLEFDVELALKKSDENPVYYVQYAYVRTRSILEKAGQPVISPITIHDSSFLMAPEALLLKKIASLKHTLVTISSTYQTHLLTYYVLELAQLFHAYYSHNRIIDIQHPEQSKVRLNLVIMVKDALELCLQLLGISCPEKM